MRGTSAIPALRFAVIAAVVVAGTSGCSTGFFLYELFKGDDDPPAPSAADAAAPVAATTETTPPPSPTVMAEAGPCAAAERCATASNDAGVCAPVSGACEDRRPDGAACTASWQCSGDRCAWDEASGGGLCRSMPTACKVAQVGCDADDHACCEGSRCHPAEFSAQPRCEVCGIEGITCSDATASTCCSGTCRFGACT